MTGYDETRRRRPSATSRRARRGPWRHRRTHVAAAGQEQAAIPTGRCAQRAPAGPPREGAPRARPARRRCHRRRPRPRSTPAAAPRRGAGNETAIWTCSGSYSPGAARALESWRLEQNRSHLEWRCGASSGQATAAPAGQTPSLLRRLRGGDPEAVLVRRRHPERLRERVGPASHRLELVNLRAGLDLTDRLLLRRAARARAGLTSSPSRSAAPCRRASCAPSTAFVGGMYWCIISPFFSGSISQRRAQASVGEVAPRPEVDEAGLRLGAPEELGPAPSSIFSVEITSPPARSKSSIVDVFIASPRALPGISSSWNAALRREGIPGRRGLCRLPLGPGDQELARSESPVARGDLHLLRFEIHTCPAITRMSRREHRDIRGRDVTVDPQRGRAVRRAPAARGPPPDPPGSRSASSGPARR